VIFGSVESEHPRLSNREIILRISNLCDHDTSTSRTDGQTTCRSNTELCVASRGKKQRLSIVVCILDDGCLLKFITNLTRKPS